MSVSCPEYVALCKEVHFFKANYLNIYTDDILEGFITQHCMQPRAFPLINIPLKQKTLPSKLCFCVEIICELIE